MNPTIIGGASALIFIIGYHASSHGQTPQQLQYEQQQREYFLHSSGDCTG